MPSESEPSVSRRDGGPTSVKIHGVFGLCRGPFLTSPISTCVPLSHEHKYLSSILSIVSVCGKDGAENEGNLNEKLDDQTLCLVSSKTVRRCRQNVSGYCIRMSLGHGFGGRCVKHLLLSAVSVEALGSSRMMSLFCVSPCMS